MTALAIIKPIATPAELLGHHDVMAKLVQDALTPDVDYGTIPGTGDKPALLKPGAEKLCLAFGARPEYELVESEIDHHVEIMWVKRKKVWNNGHRGDRSFTWGEENGKALGLYRYRYRCRIVLPDGRVLATAEGVASTLESKYVDRPRDSENTVCKMAQKRAFVSAVLHAFALSNRFTVDVEDMDRDTHVDARPVRQASAQARQSPPQQQQQRQGATAAPRGSIYNGSKEQADIIKTILKKRGVPEDLWGQIDERLMNRPSGDLDAVIAEVKAVAETPPPAPPEGFEQVPYEEPQE